MSVPLDEAVGRSARAQTDLAHADLPNRDPLLTEADAAGHDSGCTPPGRAGSGAVAQGASLENVRFENTRFDPDLAPFHGLAKAMAAQYGYSAELSGDPCLLQLLRLRVAQLNPCSYCLILHTEVAAKIGVSPTRSAHLPSWRESTMFSPAEQAALAYCEGLTTFRQEHFPALHDELRRFFTDREIAEIAAVVINMNMWTRLKLAQGAVPVTRGSESDLDLEPTGEVK